MPRLFPALVSTTKEYDSGLVLGFGLRLTVRIAIIVIEQMFDFSTRRSQSQDVSVS